MAFNPNHTAEHKQEQEKEKMWERLQYTPQEKYSKALNEMMNAIRNMYKSMDDDEKK